jgi:hypothetical protein
MVAYVGGQPAVRVITGIDHNLSENDLVRIDGVQGSVQLNNNTYYAKIINSTEFDLYAAPYDPAYAAVNDPITAVSIYAGSGWVWPDATFILETTTATATTTDPVTGNKITVDSTAELVVGTPIIFTEDGVALGDATIGGIIAGTVYYVKEIFNTTTLSISETRGGDAYVLTNDAGSVRTTQWEQTNVDRLWITVNGLRVPSSSLRLNSANQVSILVTILSTDTVIMTSMMPTATPNENRYMLIVDRNSEASVYRANSEARTWLTQPLLNTQDEIHVNSVAAVTDTIIQNEMAPVAVDGIYSFGLTVDKNLITSITVYNEATATEISSDNYTVEVIGLAPTLLIDEGIWITTGDPITITMLEGNTVLINGEQIRFANADITTNILSGLSRGVMGTGEQASIAENTEVYGLLSNNLLPNINYDLTWNSNTYNTTDGDPLQVSTTDAATFLNQNIT